MCTAVQKHQYGGHAVAFESIASCDDPQSTVVASDLVIVFGLHVVMFCRI